MKNINDMTTDEMNEKWDDNVDRNDCCRLMAMMATKIYKCVDCGSKTKGFHKTMIKASSRRELVNKLQDHLIERQIEPTLLRLEASHFIMIYDWDYGKGKLRQLKSTSLKIWEKNDTKTKNLIYRFIYKDKWDQELIFTVKRESQKWK